MSPFGYLYIVRFIKMKIIYIRILWNIIFSVAMIVVSIDMLIQPDSIIITYLSGFDLVKYILKSIGFIPTAILLFLLGLFFYTTQLRHLRLLEMMKKSNKSFNYAGFSNLPDSQKRRSRLLSRAR